MPSNIVTRFPTLIFSETFYKGLVLGVQDAEVEDSNCYSSTIAMLTLVQSADINFDSFASATIEKGETPTDFAYLITLAVVFQEFSLVFFNLYADCYFELLMI